MTIEQVKSAYAAYQSTKPAKAKGSPPETEQTPEILTDRVEISSTALTSHTGEVNSVAATTNALNPSADKPKDGSSVLTRRLVAASGQFEVRQIIADAGKDIVELRMIAAMAKGEDAKLAEEYIKRLEKLMSRAGRKIRDIDREDTLKLQKSRAEQLKQLKRVEDIKNELRKRLSERMTRENGYLLEDLYASMMGKPSSGEKLDPAAEAAIEAQAQAMAAIEASAGSSADAGGVSIEMPSGGSGEISSGGETGGVEMEIAPAE